MTDNLTNTQRSKCMSNIRSKWTKPERLLHNLLKGWKIKHKMHPNIEGHPDILITNDNLAIFIHGCFWHKCSKHYKEPKSNKDYWLPKIKRNYEKDKSNIDILASNGFSSIKIWEHDLKKDYKINITKILQNARIPLPKIIHERGR